MQKNTLAAIISSLALFLFFVLVLPQYDAIRDATKVQKSRQALLVERVAELENVKELDRQSKSRQSDLDKIRTFLPATRQTDEIVSSIQEITQVSGLQLVSMTTAETPESGEVNYRKVLVSLDLISTYPAFVNFLKLLEQNIRLYDIFDVTAAESTTSPGKINLILRLSTYYLK